MKISRIATIAFFGSIWGFLEATLGGVLHLAHVPYTGTIMSAFGLSILFAALRNGLKPSDLMPIGLIAASFKFLDCLLFGLPLLDITVINPATAIACEGLAAAVVFGGLGASDRTTSLALRFLITAAAGVVAFNAISLGIYGWPTHHTRNPIGTAFIQLPSMVILATALSKAMCMADRRALPALNSAWRAAAAAALAILAIIARVAI